MKLLQNCYLLSLPTILLALHENNKYPNRSRYKIKKIVGGHPKNKQTATNSNSNKILEERKQIYKQTPKIDENVSKDFGSFKIPFVEIATPRKIEDDEGEDNLLLKDVNKDIQHNKRKTLTTCIIETCTFITQEWMQSFDNYLKLNEKVLY